MTERGAFGRLVARLTGTWQLERLAALDAKVGTLVREQRALLADQRVRLDGLQAELATKASGETVRRLARRVEDVQTSLTQQDRAISDALERSGQLDEYGVDDRRLARRVERFLRHDRPIVVGPWTGEVGFELLYWVPFVRWVVRTYQLPPARLLVVSRGGTAPWYAGLAGRYADAFSYVGLDEFRTATVAAKKQRQVGAFDALLLEKVIAAEGLERPALLHPGMMYRLFMPYWKNLTTSDRVERYTVHEPLSRADSDVPPGLPERFVAARFYFSECFPDTPSNRQFVTSALDTLSQRTPVVLLNTPFAVDDHRDFAPSGGRVSSVAPHLAPERNLAVQTAVIARAQAFVGTYGGYSYLAPLCGVPSLAFYSARTFKSQHLHLADRVFERLGGPSLVPLDVGTVPWVRLALPGEAIGAP